MFPDSIVFGLTKMVKFKGTREFCSGAFKNKTLINKGTGGETFAISHENTDTGTGSSLNTVLSKFWLSVGPA